MTKVFKFPLNVNHGSHTLHVPIGSSFLSVQTVDNRPVAYFLVDERQEMVSTFQYDAVWTGKEAGVRFTSNYLGTVIMPNQQLVVHYFQS